jgi:hypothetical protein
MARPGKPDVSRPGNEAIKALSCTLSVASGSAGQLEQELGCEIGPRVRTRGFFFG